MITSHTPAFILARAGEPRNGPLFTKIQLDEA